MRFIAALLAGLVFGGGLVVSGMTDPAKVLGFLDLAGRWDPSLGFVMAGAVAMGVMPFAAARRRTVALLGEDIKLPTARHIDRRLVGGSVLFGVGWGIAGFCPGPALAAVGMAQPKALLFVAAMLAGMALYEFIERARA